MRLKEQVKEFVKFEERDVLTDRANWGRSLENHRLSPLLELLPEIVEALEKCDELMLEPLRTSDVFDARMLAEQTLAKIKEAVGEK